jgi:hypothetical protein
MFKTLVRCVMLMLFGLTLGLFLSWRVKMAEIFKSSPASAPSLEQIQDLSALVTTSVEIADVRLSELHGWTGGVQVALLVRGQYLLGTDLNRGRFEAIDTVAHTAVLVLPTPAVTAPRLDHNRTKVYAIIPYGLWQIVPSDRAEVAAVNQALLEAQQHLADDAHDALLVERSKRQAEAVLSRFFRAIGWDVTIRWSDRP